MREVLTNTLQWGFRTLTDDVPATGLVHNMFTGGHGSFNGLLVHSTTYAPRPPDPASSPLVLSPSKASALMAKSLANASKAMDTC